MGRLAEEGGEGRAFLWGGWTGEYIYGDLWLNWETNWGGERALDLGESAFWFGGIWE